MKKTLFFLFAAAIMANPLFLVRADATDALALEDPVRLNDMVITLLMPPIEDAVNRFYEPYLTIEPTVVPYYGSKIVSIQGGEQIHAGISNSHYTVTVEVFLYVGPHLSVGKDRITLDVQVAGVTVKNYEHLESYPLTPSYQSLMKKPLPAY
ncbi:DUF3888 domain-containing protein [Oscillibacter sp.]|uniref:DUF3888 domain-containing protein n=1 Tax=Oscillibacter sp. TaxID=1945593 RepID=UPI00260C0660|nr:DUF3888 domain-containing protein [Oscillibacter sp.]MDD3346703.1 DUF3888 domain-containing protein [Oscillibacter sp.]